MGNVDENTVLAGPEAAPAGAASFRALVAADIPSTFSKSKLREIHVPLYHVNAATATSTTYLPTVGRFAFLYTAANWDSVTWYYEVVINIDNVSNIAYAQLYDFNGGAALAGSELTTQLTVPTRLRSAALTLTDGMVLSPQWKVSAGTITFSKFALIGVQSG